MMAMTTTRQTTMTKTMKRKTTAMMKAKDRIKNEAAMVKADQATQQGKATMVEATSIKKQNG